MKCKKCKFFKSRQGKGKLGECRVNPPVIQLGSTIGEFPIIEESTWCGKAEINTAKYHKDGRKIYTRTDTRSIKPRDSYRDFAGEDTYHRGI